MTPQGMDVLRQNPDTKPNTHWSIRASSGVLLLSILAHQVLSACSAQIPTEASPTFDPRSSEVGGESPEDVNVTDLLAVKKEMTQEEIESFNGKLQDPEKEVVTYDPLGNDLYTPRKILPESRQEAVFSAVEKWVMGESERVFGHTVIDGKNMIVTESGDRLVTLVEVDLVMGQDLSARGFARIGEDGVTLVPEILFGSDGKPYINDGSANFYRLSEDSGILETIDVGELSKEYGGGTLVRNSRMRFTSGVEFVVTPEGDLVSTEWFTLQESIAASGERFTLLPDGTIQDGAITVPGLFVDKNGTITLRGVSSQVTISLEDVSFDDTNGVNAKGYTLDEATGLWGVALESTEAGAVTIAILDEMKVDLSTIELKMDGEEVVCIERATGNEVCRDGKFDLYFVQKVIEDLDNVKIGLDPISEFRPDGTRASKPNRPTDTTRIYLVDLFKKVFGEDAFSDKVGFTALMLDREENGWGLVENPKLYNHSHIQHLVFETRGGGLVKIPLMYISQADMFDFWDWE